MYLGRVKALAACVVGSVFLLTVTAKSALGEEPPELTAKQSRFFEELQKLNWVKGPTTVSVPGHSKLAIPESYVFLDRTDTKKFLELSENLASGQEVMVAPQSLVWQAYLQFFPGGVRQGH